MADKSPLEIVNAFCAAWQRGDIEELMSYFAEDAIYHNVPVAPIQGKAAIKQGFLAFASLMDGIELIMVRTAATGPVVFNERIEPAYSRLVVENVAGAPVTQGTVTVDPEDARKVAVTLGPLPAGRYTVRYRVLSVDGHIVESQITFTVRDR